MDMTYNNLRGIEQFKNKLTSSLQKRNLSKIDIDKCVSKAVDLFGDKIGVMPVGGAISAINAVSAIEKHLDDNPVHDILDAINSFSIHELKIDSEPSGSLRLSLDDVRSEGKMDDANLDKIAQEIHESVEDSDNLVSVMTYDEYGRPVKEFKVSSVNMIDYMEEEDLSDEGRRSRGFLPADYDSTDVLSTTTSVSTGSTRTIGNYRHESDGSIYIQCPSCLSKDVIPVGAGTYMCLTCEPESTFDIDLLLDDINPEMN
jgi:hypothetical protein